MTSAGRLTAALARAATEAAELRAELDIVRTAGIGAHALLTDAETEIERLRAALASKNECRAVECLAAESNLAEVQRLTRDNTEHTLRADLLRRQVTDLTNERDALLEESRRWRANSHEISRLAGEVHAEHTINTGLAGDLTSANAEVERLRGLLTDHEKHVHTLADALITARHERHARGDYDNEEMQDVRAILHTVGRLAGLT